MKKNEEIKASIINLVRKLNPTKTMVCKKHGITWQTLKNWMQEDDEFAKAYKGAIKDYLDNINIEAKKSLAKLIKGYYSKEEKTIYVEGPEDKVVIVQKTVTKKHIGPNASAVTFALSNLDPENFE
ncbi:MAG TPA: hypothetical protein VJY42_00330 [Candidatus Methanomethylophilaceae archaeon]|nr:hypothetical protein [Candidatus Methanomethylophilaceae archaeon]